MIDSATSNRDLSRETSSKHQKKTHQIRFHTAPPGPDWLSDCPVERRLLGGPPCLPTHKQADNIHQSDRLDKNREIKHVKQMQLNPSITIKTNHGPGRAEIGPMSQESFIKSKSSRFDPKLDKPTESTIRKKIGKYSYDLFVRGIL